MRPRQSFVAGRRAAWDRNLDPADPLRDLDKYDRLMLAKAYALVKTYRSTPAGPDVPRTTSAAPGGILATLENSTSVDYASLNDSANYLKDFGEVAGHRHNVHLAHADGQPVRAHAIELSAHRANCEADDPYSDHHGLAAEIAFDCGGRPRAGSGTAGARKRCCFMA